MVLTFLALQPALAQQQRVPAPESDIASWTVETGLPHDSVASIQQSAEGFLWVGTSEGVARFDGWKFTPVIAYAASKKSAVGPLRISAQCVDAANQVWIGSEHHGLFRLDPALAPPLRATGMGLESERIHALGADTNGSVWIGTGTGLFRWDGQQFSRIELEPGLAPAAVLALQVTPERVWLTTRAGLRKVENGLVRPVNLEFQTEVPGFRGVFEGRRGALWYFGDTYLLQVAENRRFNYFRSGGSTPLQAWSICEGRSGQLWIGTSGQGLFHFRNNRFDPVDLRQDRDHSDVRSVFMDKDGQLWVGTRTGLLRLREKAVRWYGGTAGPATCLAQDTFGRVWAGFHRGGMYSGRPEFFESAADLIAVGQQNLISSLYIRPTDSSFWVGTYGQGLLRVRQGRVQRYTTAHGLSDDSILAVCGGMAGRVWVSTADGKVHRFMEQWMASFDTGSGLTGDPVTAMLRGSDGTLWAGTSKGDVLRFSRERFYAVQAVPAFKGKAVTALCEDAQERLWVGTDGGGIGCFEHDDWRLWNQEHGLTDNRVIALEMGAQERIWVATHRGVSVLPESWTSPGQPPSLAERPGPLPLEVEFPALETKPSATGWPRSLRTRQNVFWFATDHGVVNFSPADLGHTVRAQPVRVEAVWANGVSMPVSGKTNRRLRLPVRLREIQIRFTAPSLSDPEKIRFRHRLEGFDPGWIDSSEMRMAQYGKLPGGDYEFRVQCSDREGNWSGPETLLQLRIPVPFWRTPLALALQSLLLAGGVAAAVRAVSHRRLKRQLERAEQQRAMERDRSRIAQDMHDELGAKLTKISFMSERVRRDVARAAANEDVAAKVESIATTSRRLLHSLDEIVWAVNPRNDTLESLVAYLAQYASEYIQNTPLELDLHMPGPLPEAALSAEVRHNLFLAFQEALGNALKHSGATRVHVSMALEGREFQILVRDNGGGVSEPSAMTANVGGAVVRRGGMGLRGMRERLEKSGGVCEITSSPGQGTSVTLKIPIKSTTNGK